MANWVETPFDYLTSLADPTGRGLITSLDGSDVNPKPFISPPVPVMIRGMYFGSYKAAGEALGLSPSTIRYADLAGRLDKLQTRHWWEVQGIEFQTIPEVMEFFKLGKKPRDVPQLNFIRQTQQKAIDESFFSP